MLTRVNPLVARCLLVGASVALAAVGVLARLPGPSRAVLLVAAACCAGLDLVLVRTWPTGRSLETVVVVGPPVRDECEAAAADGTRSVSRPLDPGRITLGTEPDGHAVTVDVVGTRTHVVVVGRGAVAHAVFRALAVQVLAVAGAQGFAVRSAAPHDLAALVGSSGTSSANGTTHVAAGSVRVLRRDLPEGTAVVAADPCGPAPLTVVLVPGHGQVPRRWDVAIEVTRYGVTVRRRDEARGRAVAPALPCLDASHPAVTTCGQPR